MSFSRIPSLRLITGFEAAARHKSFVRAAEELCLSQSAISHQVQQLESKLGQPLFIRIGRGVELTKAGEVLLRTSRVALATLQGGMKRITSYLDPGLVTLVCPQHIQQGWMQGRLVRMLKDLPGLCPIFSNDESAQYVDELDVDLNILDRHLDIQGVIGKQWLRDSWIVVATPELVARLEGLEYKQQAKLADLLCLESSIAHSDCEALLLGPLAVFHKSMIFEDARLLLDATLRGLGIACIPRLLADESLNKGVLQRLPNYPELPGATYWLARIEGCTRSPLIQSWYTWLCDEATVSQESYFF